MDSLVARRDKCPLGFSRGSRGPLFTGRGAGITTRDGATPGALSFWLEKGKSYASRTKQCQGHCVPAASTGFLRCHRVFATPGTAYTVLCRFKIWLEGLYRDLNRQICVGTPQFVTGGHNGVQPLRIVTMIDSDRVRIHVTALAPLHHAQLSPRIAWQACMGLWMDVSGAYAISRFEECRCLLLAEV